MIRLLSIVFAALIFAGCSKENSDSFVPYNNHPLNDTSWIEKIPADAPAMQIQEDLSPAPVTGFFSPTTTVSLHLSDKLDITIPSGSCIYTDGSQVTGNVSIAVSALTGKGDFIRYGRPTTSMGKVLEYGGGAFYVDFYQDNKEVVLKSGKNIIITIKDPTPVPDRKLFYGAFDLQQPLPAGTNPNFTWIKSGDSSRVTTFTRQDSTGVTRGYTIFSRKSKWLNCADYVDTTLPAVTMTATFPFNFTNKNTTVYAVFKDKKTVVQLNADFANRSFFAPNIPVNSNVTIISLSKFGDQMYLGRQDVLVNNDVVTIIKPEVKSEEEIQQYLNSL